MTPKVRQRADVTATSTDIRHYAHLVSERFAPLSLSTDREAFHGVIHGRTLGPVYAFDVQANQHSVSRTARDAAASPRETYQAHVQLAGRGHIVQGGRGTELGPGDVAFYDSDAAYGVTVDDDFHHLILVFPRMALGVPADGAAQLAATRLGGDGAAGLARSFLVQLARTLESAPGYVRTRLVHSAVDMLGIALLEELGHSPVDTGRPSRARVHAEALAYIEDHLHEPDLAPGQIAAALFVSVRHLHAAFADTGQTVSGRIRERRLEHCARDFVDPLLAHIPLSRIAAGHGYLDMAHFSRLFKCTYGQSPRDFRATYLNLAG
ncbi:helix-turn-helix domain-containing protein [Paenarthrobacter aurescens]|uniref:Transcriptional regulator, AraC family n=1 Tax=Paenarthrobacter aurescens (strain TC1) TaxID=290340 RepID=A1RDF3_PAEAT|nr:helix-turn-helix domain-containing protein [Paenarthrobacter aurescens]ABM10712.1 transcriptional regulator, AraC family [Paenarthrobacter aurescens TC1]